VSDHYFPPKVDVKCGKGRGGCAIPHSAVPQENLKLTFLNGVLEGVRTGSIWLTERTARGHLLLQLIRLLPFAKQRS
jgi:hypothetical protein